MAHAFPQVDDVVELTIDLPDLGLRRGERGVVCSTWFSPAPAYEIDFAPPELGHHLRALLLQNELALDGPTRA